MNPTIKNILAILAGFAIGSLVNMGILMVSSSVIPLPDGADVSDMENLKKSMPLFEAKHFIFPFLAHALGTLVGAIAAYQIASDNKMRFAMIIGGAFLIGGIVNCFMLPAPTWFEITDVLAAYLPMAYLGGRIMTKK